MGGDWTCHIWRVFGVGKGRDGMGSMASLHPRALVSPHVSVSMERGLHTDRQRRVSFSLHRNPKTLLNRPDLVINLTLDRMRGDGTSNLTRCSLTNQVRSI